MLLGIRFDGIAFTTLGALSQYIVSAYGCWASVPDDHLDIAVVNALCGYNDKYYVEANNQVCVRGHDLEEDTASCCHCGLESCFWAEAECTSTGGHSF